MTFDNKSNGSKLLSDYKRLHDGLSLAFLAAQHSQDLSRRVGAAIVCPSGEIISACNRMPSGVKYDLDRITNRTDGEKYFWIEHAERNAIYHAAERGVALRGSVMFATLFPCADCARAIIQAGIIELVIPKSEGAVLRFERSTEVARIMLNEAGVVIREVTPPSSTQKRTPEA